MTPPFTSDLSVVPPQPGGGQTLTEFDVKWRHWHEEVDRYLQDNSFASNKHLEIICKVSEFMPVEHAEFSSACASPHSCIYYSFHQQMASPVLFIDFRSWWGMKTLCWSTRNS